MQLVVMDPALELWTLTKATKDPYAEWIAITHRDPSTFRTFSSPPPWTGPSNSGALK